MWAVLLFCGPSIGSSLVLPDLQSSNHRSIAPDEELPVVVGMFTLPMFATLPASGREVGWTRWMTTSVI